MPGNKDPLKANQELVVEIDDSKWNAYIQQSESFSLSQYESYLRQYESNVYDPSDVQTDAKGKVIKVDKKPVKNQKKPIRTSPWHPTTMVDKVVSLTDDILSGINTAKKPASSIANLKGLLQIVVNYIIRGQYPASSPINAPGKFSFALMSRTHFGSMYQQF